MLLQDVLEDCCREIVSLVLDKNKRYRNSYLKTRRGGDKAALIIRLRDKFNRLKYLEKSDPENEKAWLDAIKDMIGYLLLELYFQRVEEYFYPTAFLKMLGVKDYALDVIESEVFISKEEDFKKIQQALDGRTEVFGWEFIFEKGGTSNAESEVW